MRILSIFPLAFVTWAVAQTPAGFNPATNQSLSMNFNGQVYPTAGTQVLPDAVASVPSVTGPSGLSGYYLLLMVNPDSPPPPDIGKPEFIHWIQPDVTADASGLLSSTSPPYKSYQPPTPLAGESPQHFIVLLFQQPSSTFTVPSSFQQYANGSSPGFNTSEFESQGNLQLIAGNYVLVAPASGSNSTTATPGSSNTTTSGAPPTAIPFSAAATRVLKMPVIQLLGVLFGLVLSLL